MSSVYLPFMFANSSTIFIILLAFFHTVITYTHWVLNDQGRIRSKVYSEFQLRKPENLVIFLRTDDDLMHLKQVKTELAKEKKFLEVERDEEKVDLVMKYHAEDEDCLLAGKPLKKFDLKISTLIPFDTLGIRYSDHIDFISELPPTKQAPFCTVSLPFSMITMDHLEGLVKRDELKNYSEKELNRHFFAEYHLESLGNRVKFSLNKNETSWVLLNVAALYWRIKGNALEAIECLRRALYYSHGEGRGMSLMSMANVLHRTGYSRDASILVRSSLHYLRDKKISWFSLGNIFASLGQYASAEICFREAIEIHPGFKNAKQRLHAVLCEKKLQRALEQQHDILKSILVRMENYQEKHKKFENDENVMLSRVVPEELQLKKHYIIEKTLAQFERTL